MENHDRPTHTTRRAAKEARDQVARATAEQARTRRARTFKELALAVAGPCIAAAVDVAVALFLRR